MWDKLKSWKRWAWVISTVLPIVLEALTGKITWPVAGGASFVALLTGMGIIAQEDVAKIKAKAEEAKAAQETAK